MGAERVSDLAELIRIEDRVIEVAGRDSVVARELAERGRSRYLGLLDAQVLAAVRDEASELAHRFRPLSETPSLRAVGADVLILHNRAVRWLWSPGDLRGIRMVAAPVGSWEAKLASGSKLRGDKLSLLGDAVVGRQRYRFFEMPGRRAPRPRVYLSPIIGHAGLLSRLNETDIRAVVLRWFEDLPHVKPGEDLDLLVSDEDVEKVRALITDEPGTLPIDLYSVTGLPGSDREGLPCYPPPLAQRIVDRAVRHASGAWVPAPDDHLHSLAHHVVYHKGETSGLPSTLVDSKDGLPADHDYRAVLAGLADKLRIDLPGHIEGLEDHLNVVGWRPPVDTLRRLSTKNRWVKRRFFDEALASSDEPEPAVFIFRSRALDAVDIGEVRGLLERLGFEIVEHRKLDQAAVARCAMKLRGGNWGQGPYPTSGGIPASVMVVLHYSPTPVEPRLRKKYPHLTNREVLRAKERLRSLFNRRVAPDQRCNPVHSSDNEEEAWEYLAVAMPDDLSRFQALVGQHRAAYRTPQRVINVLNRDRRGKIEVVEFAGGCAVRKTFTPRYLRQLELEKKLACAVVNHSGIPQPLASGSNWVIWPYVRDQLHYSAGSPSLIPLQVLREMVQILRTIHDAGFALLNAKPSSFQMDDDGVKLVSHEFLYQYPDEPPPFHRSYSWHGSPPSDVLDVPKGRRSYQQVWLRWTGMPIEALCYATPRHQRHLRVRFRIGQTTRRITRMVRGGPSRLAAIVRRATGGVRARGRARYGSWARKRALTSLAPHR